MEEEKFYPLKGYEDNFEITKTGKVRNTKTGRLLKPFLKRGYYRVRLYYKGKRIDKPISRLLGLTFLPNPNNCKSVCFKTENKLDYSLDNLYWTNSTPGVKKKINILEPGTKFCELIVMKDLGKVKGTHKVLCKCSCGEEKEYVYSDLNKGYKTDCGHVEKEKIYPLNIKKINNRLLKDPETKKYILEEISAERKNDETKRRVKTKCRNCGYERKMSYYRVYSSRKSCDNCAVKGQGAATHNLSSHPLYLTFRNMKSRCYSKNHPDYKRYGGRGIKICDEWLKDFKNFYDWAINNGWNFKLSIERVDNDGNYEPSNCDWVDQPTQNRNQSTTKLDWDKVKFIRGSNLSYKELANKFKVSVGTIECVKSYRTWVE